ncbi:hypothetical protein [Homoserinibacter sp. YIM 151385]|uniref:hypothetical protein n=1 Tax=Homoserinibacter sp. YIM 151385 TaxID=2985506 RepID=UPI0022EFE2D2|nr:hypothetical protein [Homoserinibacter sp. YIM 151385]WBU37191.1 hypothetical protein OF852_09690 [Homoserinibacter sp. YIM 151385]
MRELTSVHRRRLLLAPVAITTLALLTTGVSPAVATDHVEATAELIEDVAPDQGDVVAGVDTAAGVTATAAGVIAEIPEYATVPLLVDADEHTVNLALPDEFPLGAGRPASDGTVVYPARDRTGDALAVQLLDDGSTRVQTIIGSSDSVHEFGYSIEGYVPVSDDTGEQFGFLGQDGQFVPLGEAWARDAGGNAVATNYEIRGNEIVQVIGRDATAEYPVVADPVWIWMYAGYGAKLNRYETKKVRDYGIALGMCGALAKRFPNFVVACTAYAAYMVAQANLAESDRPKKTCLFLVVAPGPFIFRYHDAHCK